MSLCGSWVMIGMGVGVWCRPKSRRSSSLMGATRKDFEQMRRGICSTHEMGLWRPNLDEQDRIYSSRKDQMWWCWGGVGKEERGSGSI